MRVWISCLFSLIIMLATLSIAPDLSTQSTAFNIDFARNVLVACLIILLILQLFFKQWLLKQSFKQKTYNNSLTRTPKSLLLLQSFMGCVLLLTLGFHTLNSVEKTVDNEIKTSIRVLATVTPIGVSDSIFYPSAGMGYRQLMMIESVEPLTLNHFDKKDSGHFNQQLIELNGKTVLVSARFRSIPKKSKLPVSFSRDFSGLNQLQPSQSTQMFMEIKPVPKAESGFIHRWFRSRHVNAQATVLAYQKDFVPIKNANWQTKLNQWRWQVREHFLHKNDWQQLTSEQQQAFAVTLSLFTGDRALISKDIKDLYQLSGISHLLAISGTHVLFLAVLLSFMVVAMVNRFFSGCYLYLPRYYLRWLVMVVAALSYALFTGFDVPSARTVYMLMTVGLARVLLVNISARQVLLLVAVAMAIYDPYVLWQAGFWLSFVAVMLLVSYDVSMNDTETVWYYSDTTEVKKIGLFHKLWPFIKLQLWMFVALLPLSLLLFGKVSLWGVLVNVVAIGFYGWIVVPLNLLAGLLYWLLPSFLHALPDMLWIMVSWLLKNLHHGLSWLVGSDEPSSAWLYTNVNFGMMFIIGLIVLPMLLPRKTFSRLWSIPPMVLLGILLFNQPHTLSHSKIGHGTQYTQDKLILLNTKYAASNQAVTSQLLIHSNGKDNESWLMVSSHQKSLKHGMATSLDSNELNKQWHESLGELGVSSLTGIIIQTPTLELFQAAKSLKSTMPIGYLWVAGNQHIIKSDVTGQFKDVLHSTLSCGMGRNWQSDDGMLQVKALTGWQDIDDHEVWPCVLQIDSQSAIVIDTQYPLYWSDNQGNHTVRSIIPKRQVQKNLMPSFNQIIINVGIQNDKLWKLWALLCPIDNDDVYSNGSQGSGVLLTHSYNGLPNELINNNKHINHWILMNQSTEYNQQHLTQLLLDWQNQAINKNDN